MTMITPSYLGETIEYSSLHACRSTLEDPTPGLAAATAPSPVFGEFSYGLIEVNHPFAWNNERVP